MQLLKRYDQSNNLVDNFTYTYYSGNNRLKNIGSGQDYTYDNNGNVVNDDLNKNTAYKYDWRNLMIENTDNVSLSSFRTYNWYDEVRQSEMSPTAVILAVFIMYVLLLLAQKKNQEKGTRRKTDCSAAA